MSVTEAVLIDEDGEPTAYLGPALRENLPSHVLEGLTRRRLVALGQTCPCGARLVLPNRAERRAARKAGHGPVWPVQVAHENDCPAVCPELLDGRGKGRT